MEAIKARIKKAEGLRLKVYLDTRGFLTVGYGHRVNSRDGLKLDDVITLKQAEDYFEHDFAWVEAGVTLLVPDFAAKPKPIQMVLIEMAYNNGLEGLKDFKKCLKAANANDWQKMADEIVDSANYRSEDLHGRYVELEQMVRSVK